MELLFKDVDIASETCVEVICMGVGAKALVCLSIFLLVILVGCLMVLTSCLLKAEAFVEVLRLVCH